MKGDEAASSTLSSSAQHSLFRVLQWGDACTPLLGTYNTHSSFGSSRNIHNPLRILSSSTTHTAMATVTLARLDVFARGQIVAFRNAKYSLARIINAVRKKDGTKPHKRSVQKVLHRAAKDPKWRGEDPTSRLNVPISRLTGPISRLAGCRLGGLAGPISRSAQWRIYNQPQYFCN